MSKVFFSVVALLLAASTFLHSQNGALAIEGIVTVDEYSGEQGYYLFCPQQKPAHPTVPVVFLHGYGGLNPMIYGKWIRHLTDNGHCVIYPRYQNKILGTSPNDFVTNTSAAIAAAYEALDSLDVLVDASSMYLIGHSYGGVISANLAANWRILRLPQPRVALLCQPGSGPFKGGLLASYEGMDSLLHLTIIVGDHDETVGQEFGREVYESAANTPNRVLLWQYACAQDTFRVTAGHYEPYALDLTFDNGIENFTSRKALRVARHDHVDTEGYWKVFSLLVEKDRAGDCSQYADGFLDRCADLGSWPDGTGLCKMDVHYPSTGNGK